jgi:putative polyhydroxyalkanoate system protein
MPDLHIHRDHDLGLDRARAIARDWVSDAQARLGLTCTHEAGDAQDCIRFERPGVSGHLRVSASRFELEARLGFLLGGFKARIEQEISANLDALLANRDLTAER